MFLTFKHTVNIINITSIEQYRGACVITEPFCFMYKVMNIIKRYCNDEVDVKFIFDCFKVGQYFSNKDPIPKELISHVIYKFVCASCKACYVGETARHISTRVNEHLETDKASSVYKHIRENTSCKHACNSDCFSILDRARTTYQLSIKEGTWIRKINPSLNKQVKSYQVKLML